MTALNTTTLDIFWRTSVCYDVLDSIYPDAHACTHSTSSSTVSFWPAPRTRFHSRATSSDVSPAADYESFAARHSRPSCPLAVLYVTSQSPQHSAAESPGLQQVQTERHGHRSCPDTSQARLWTGEQALTLVTRASNTFLRLQSCATLTKTSSPLTRPHSLRWRRCPRIRKRCPYA